MNAWIGAAALAAATLGVGSAVSSPAAAVGEVGWLVAADTAGKAIYTGKGNCGVCHGADAKGTVLAPDLTDDEWLHSDGSLAGILKTVKEGVAAPKKYPAPMPPMGGGQLTDADVQAVSQYVHSLRADAK
jgi:cbb3-type cytochrome c oxidase subunit III